MSSGLTVRGGAGGISAELDDLTLVAHLYAQGAAGCAGQAAALGALATGPALAESAALDPVGAGRAVLELTRSAVRLTACAAGCAGLSAALQAAAELYRAADAVHSVVGTDLLPLVVAPAAAVRGAAALVTTGHVATAVERVVTADPGLVDGLLLTVPGGAGGLTDALAPAWPDGSPSVVPLDRQAADPPRSVPDLVAGLADRDDGQAGEVDVRFLVGQDGRRRVVVDIPGTKDWSLSSRQTDVTSLATNLRALDGCPTSYEQGVLEAMRRAGVTPEDDVLLIGHSQGGMIAVDLATHCSDYRISHVITAGSPVALTAGALPATVQLLALENAADVVPHLDGGANPDRPNVITAQFRCDHGGVLANHDLRASYLPGAALVDASSDPSVHAFLDGLGDFLTAGQASTATFLITRRYR